MGFRMHMFICLLFWELLLLKYSLTIILTCKSSRRKPELKKIVRSEMVVVVSDEKHVFP